MMSEREREREREIEGERGEERERELHIVDIEETISHITMYNT